MQATRRQPQRAPDGASLHYERHRPEQTTLYRLLFNVEPSGGRTFTDKWA